MLEEIPECGLNFDPRLEERSRPPLPVASEPGRKNHWEQLAGTHPHRVNATTHSFDSLLSWKVIFALDTRTLLFIVPIFSSRSCARSAESNCLGNMYIDRVAEERIDTLLLNDGITRVSETNGS